LIKPVQRLLKYSLLLTAIIAGTPDDHEDKQNLKVAKEKMDEVARGVNEGRRRREVVKEVLTGGDIMGAKKKGLNVGVAASVRLGNMKGIRNAAKSREGSDGNDEKELVLKMEAELKQCDAFIRYFAKDVVAWGKTMMEMMTCLSDWTESFGRVIGISENQISESFNAFQTVVDHHLLPLCNDLVDVINNRLLPQLSVLLETTLSPSRLLEAMHTLEPLHYGLLNLNVSKSRPPPALLEASKSYIALRGQLSVELPQFLALLHKGIVAAIIQVAVWQGQFWGDVSSHWADLWEALKVDGEIGVGNAPQTVTIWWERFSAINDAMSGLSILKKIEKVSHPKASPPERVIVSKSPKQPPKSPKEPQRRNSKEPSRLSTSRVLNILASLEPAVPGAPSLGHVPRRSFAPPLNDEVPPKRKGSRRSSDASRRSSRKEIPSEYEFISGPSPTSPSSIGYFLDPQTDEVHAVPIRRKSTTTRAPDLPAPPPTPPAYEEDLPVSHSGKPSMRRKLADNIRNSASSSGSSSGPPVAVPARRTPSLPSLVKSKSFPRPPPSPAPSLPSRGSTPYTTPVILYECAAVSPFDVGREIKYEGIAFHKLRIGDRLGILKEAGHPCTHPNLPISVDDGEDCLLLARDNDGLVGWVFASFLVPVD
jgi:hypothetical protein